MTLEAYVRLGRTVSDVVFVYLTIRLDDAETVRDCVRDDRGREADKGLSLWRASDIGVGASVSDVRITFVRGYAMRVDWRKGNCMSGKSNII
jgi:hypothetical protein